MLYIVTPTHVYCVTFVVHCQPPTTNSEPIPTPPSPEANPAEDETDDDEE